MRAVAMNYEALLEDWMSIRRTALALAISCPLYLAAQSEPAPPTPAGERQILVVAAKVGDLAEDHYAWPQRWPLLA